MDYTITPTKPRSLVRRLAMWTTALGVLGGGGYGGYRYAPTRWFDAAPDQSATADANVEAAAESPSDRLLAAMPRGGAATSFDNRYAAPIDAIADRYVAAPVLPPAPVDDEEVTTPRSASAVETPTNPFGGSPVANYGDRFGAPAPPAVAPSTEPATTTPDETVIDAAAADAAAVDGVSPPPAVTVIPTADSAVARGQEPESLNPLRGAAQRSDSLRNDEAADARSAFTDGATPPTTPGTITMAGAESAPPGALRYGAAAAELAEPTRADADATAERLTISTPAPTTYGGESALAPAPSAPPAYADVMPPTPASQPLATAAGQFSPTLTDADPGITPTPGLATADGTGRPGERILEGLQTPALTIQKLAPPEIQVGKKATFAVRVQNNSQRTAHNVVIADEVPLGAQLVGTAPKANVSGSQVQWDLGTLSVGEERIVEMELLPTDEGELGSVATVTFATQASAKARCTRPQIALRLSANPRVMIGQQQIVQIEVTNPGSGDATGVMLLESIPQGVSHEAGPALEFEVGTLRPGETRRLELVLQADEAGLIDNIMTARADANLQVQANCQFEVIAPELKVTVDGPQKRFLERPATYTVSVDNPGTASAREVQLVTQLPKGLQFVSANNMGEYDAATHSVYWSLAELPANQRGSVELTALPVEAGDHTLQFATRAAQGLEDRAEAHVTVEGIVALTFEVQGDDGAIEVGGETSYQIRVVNQGSKAASNVQVVAVMPTGLRAQSGQGDSRYQVQGERVVFAPLAQLAPKGEATFQFRAQGLRPGDQRVTLQVTTDEVREPIIEVESTQVYADE